VNWRALAGEFEAPMTRFCQRLVQTPSLPGEEGDVARLVHAELQQLGYDEVTTDNWGNVVGLLRGSGGGPSVMLNTHLDHVDPGDPALWPIPPYEGRIVDGVLTGGRPRTSRAPPRRRSTRRRCWRGPACDRPAT
jgi:acetylornithine deacetylase/succinyl-diaminopimelate desuccinylase-like protein